MSHADPNHWNILRLLKAKPGAYVSGTLLASHLGLSRTGIWKHIQNLRTMGYEITSHPKEGYRLEAVPDLLLPEEVLPNLGTAWLGNSYHYFEEIESTNDRALSLAAQNAPHGTVVVAEKQTAGKGRLARSWASPSHQGIYVSVLLRVSIPTHEAPQCNLVAALALSRILSRDYALKVSIKWPNDVLLQGKKVAGILTEMQSDQDVTRFLVLGMGINVHQGEKDFEGDFRYPATSVALEMGHPVMRAKLLVQFLREFEVLFDAFLRSGFSSLLEELEGYSHLRGQEVKVHLPQGNLTGRVTGFTREGALKLQTSEGRETIIWAGDVTRLEGQGS